MLLHNNDAEVRMGQRYSVLKYCVWKYNVMRYGGDVRFGSTMEVQCGAVEGCTACCSRDACAAGCSANCPYRRDSPAPHYHKLIVLA